MERQLPFEGLAEIQLGAAARALGWQPSASVMELKPKATLGKTNDFQQKLEGHLRGLLEPGETLMGVSAASQQKGLFSGGVVALGVTGSRLIIQPLDRKGRELRGEATSLTRDQLDKIKVRRAGGAWDSPSDMVMSAVAITIKLKTTDGEKFQFSLMDGSTAQPLKTFLGESAESSI